MWVGSWNDACGTRQALSSRVVLLEDQDLVANHVGEIVPAVIGPMAQRQIGEVVGARRVGWERLREVVHVGERFGVDDAELHALVRLDGAPVAERERPILRRIGERAPAIQRHAATKPEVAHSCTDGHLTNGPFRGLGGIVHVYVHRRRLVLADVQRRGADLRADDEHLVRSGQLHDQALDLTLVDGLDRCLVLEIFDRARVPHQREPPGVEGGGLGFGPGVVDEDVGGLVLPEVHALPGAHVPTLPFGMRREVEDGSVDTRRGLGRALEAGHPAASNVSP